MNEIDAAWLAGILEGEGCFDVWKATDHAKKYARIRIEMTDEDVIQRVKAIVGGGGGVRRVEPRKSTHQVTFQYQVVKQPEVAAVLDAIHPWMSTRRAARIVELRLVLTSNLLSAPIVS